MPIYAIATDGPIDNHNRKFYVEILKQHDGAISGQFTCRELGTKKRWRFDAKKLELAWLSEESVEMLDKRYETKS